MVAEPMPKVAVSDDCPKCGGKLTDGVLPPERAKCIDCGFRLYEDRWMTDTSGEGGIVRVRYQGDVDSFRQLEPMVAFILPGCEKTRPSRLHVTVLCPICRGIDELTMMRRSKGCSDRWICAVGHSLRLHRSDGVEVVGWS